MVTGLSVSTVLECEQYRGLTVYIGVLTKPDRIQVGDESMWVDRFKGDPDQSTVWFCVKRPGPSAIKEGISWDVARQQEKDFFTQKLPWCSFIGTNKQRLGTENLTVHLSDVLSGLISKRFVIDIA